MKRCRKPTAKPNELKVEWGKLPHENPDIIYCWGENVPKVDSRYLHWIFGCEHPSGQVDDKGLIIWDPSVLDELEKRGYDLTTLKFSIKKKEDKCGDE